MGAVFIFSLFFTYGTYDITIERACVRNLDEIITLRSHTELGDLKQLSPDEIAYRIREFFLVIMNGETVGCFRIFASDLYPELYELGSVVSTRRWIGRMIVSHTEELARTTKKVVIAITGGKLDPTLEKQGWKIATEKYKTRMEESLLDKKCWEFPNS